MHSESLAASERHSLGVDTLSAIVLNSNISTERCVTQRQPLGFLSLHHEKAWRSKI